jgi:MFS family permease
MVESTSSYEPGREPVSKQPSAPGPLRRVGRWLVGVDKPVPERSDAQVIADRERNYRWNFAVNLGDGAAFWFGYSFASSSTILPLFVSKLTPSPFALGLLAVLAQGAWLLPQLFTANVVERLPRKKPVVIRLGLFLERLPVWLLVLAALLASKSAALGLAVFFIGYAWHGLGAGFVATAWQDLVARCFPVDRRGRLMGTTMFIGAGMGALGSGFSAWLLTSFDFPTNFVYTFIIAAAAITLSWFSLSLTREPVQPVKAPRRSNRQFWAGLPHIVRQDHNFRRYLIARLLMALGGMGVGFVAVAAVTRWQVPDSTVGVFTGVMLVGQTISNLAFGWLADRYGHKISLEIGALASMLAFALAWIAPAPAWFYAVFALLGVTMGAVIVSGILVVMEFSEPERRPTYVGLANTGAGLVGMAAPLLGAALAGVAYTWLFAVSAAINLLALVLMRWWVQEPRWANSAEGQAYAGSSNRST